MLTLIVKPTENCNANCLYCSVDNKHSKLAKMNHNTLHLLFSRINEYLNASYNNEVNITWHGGEPLLMGPVFYERVCDIQRKILQENSDRISYSMQSNLTLFDNSYLDVLKSLRITQIGSSFEFVHGIRGIGKKVDSNTYNMKFFEAVKKLKMASISFGIIYVVTSKSIKTPVETINYLVNIVENRENAGIRINPVYIEGEARKKEFREFNITPVEYGHFIGKAFVHWFNRRHIFPNIQPFYELYEHFLSPNSSLCCDESGSCSQSHLGIDPFGNIYQCGRAMDSNVLKYGDLKNNSFLDIFNHQSKKMLIGRSRYLSKTHCKDCRFFDFCHGGCPIDGYIYFTKWYSKSFLCVARKIFFEEYFEPLIGRKIERKSYAQQ